MIKWISGKDELPEPYKRNLVLFRGHFYDGISNYVDTAWLNNKNEWEKCNHCGIYLYPYPITHWLPLPKPPED